MSSQSFYSRIQLAAELGCSARTLNRKLELYGITLPPGLITHADAEAVKAFFQQQVNLVLNSEPNEQDYSEEEVILDESLQEEDPILLLT
jgi:hypothetical protein